ncbi:MAG TPA: type VI secretion system-associated FHA domain protein TagH, partial [Steroidobacteraceae bacterium]|nr:type VI secretion system-associated FHA domain protein TagH [Steroidobacteraceae bacterium]
SARKTFSSGGTIGRLPDNDWVFPDEYISGHHARILCSNGGFLIEDTSTNGVFINSPQNRLTRNKPYPLRGGEIIFIDDYEVRVTLVAERTAESSAPARRAPPTAPFPDEPLIEGLPGGVGAPTATDPLALLGLQSGPAVRPGPSAASLQNQSPLAQHYRPPSPVRPPQPAPQEVAPAPPKAPPPGFIPDDYDPMGADEDPFASPPDPPASRPAPVMTPPPAPVRPAPNPPAAPPARAVPAAPSAAAPTAFTSPTPPRVPKPGPKPMPAEPRVVQPASGVGREVPRDARPPVSGDPFEGSDPYARSGRNVTPERAPAPVPPPRPAPPPQAARPAAPSSPAPSSPRAPAGSREMDFAVLLEAAGLEGARVTPELAQQFGQILRVVVAGLMDVLRARDKIKDEFRMRMTTYKQADNNPLKFSVNVEDALHNLLVKRNAAYLGPVEAFEDAFLDVRNHQMAMLAGVRVAYEAMLAEFDPERLQKEFDPAAKGANFLAGGAKAKYWELYRNRFHDMVKDADSSFRHLFGDDFAKAYEEQLARLKAANRAERK